MVTAEALLHERVESMRDRLLAVGFGGELVEWHTSDHSHPVAQLMALTYGTASIRTPTGAWVLPPERCLYLPPDTIHALDTAGEVRGFVLYLTQDLAAELPREVATFQASRLLIEIARRLAELAGAQDVSTQEANLVRVLMDEIHRAIDAPLVMQMPVDLRLRSMAEQILLCPSETKTIEAWAMATGISERTLLRRFKDETGLTVGRWVQHARVHFADRQLRSGASVKQAAATAGYDSVSSFIKSFTRVMGKTPGEARQRYLDGASRARMA
jgi:AraC-like DNA-binding protein